MAREIVWSEPATDDLAEIVEFIARDSEFYADLMERKFHETARSLTRFPFRSRMVPEFGDDSLREIIVFGYRLIFQITDERILILGVLHCARDIRRLARN